MIGGEYPAQSMFGGIPMSPGIAPPPPPPTGIPKLSMPSQLTVVASWGFRQLTIDEYDTTLRIVQ